MDVVVIHPLPAAVGSDAEVTAACIQLWQCGGAVILPLPIDVLAIFALPDLIRVPRAKISAVQASHALVEMVLVRVPSTLVEQADVRSTLDSRKSNAALVGHHLLSSVSINSAIKMTQTSSAAAQTGQNIVLLSAEASLEWAEDVLAGKKVFARSRIRA